MKKRLVSIAVILSLLVTFSVSLISCSPNFDSMEERDRAFKMLEYSTDRMDRISSYKSESSSSYDVIISGSGRKEEVRSTLTVKSGLFGFSYLFENEDSYELYSEGLLVAEDKITSSDGFIDGKMFRTGKIGRNTYAQWMTLTADEYIKYLNANGSEQTPWSFTAEEAANASSKKNDNGTYTSVFSGFSEERLAKLSEYFGDVANIAEGYFELKDFEITFIYTSNFYISSIDILPKFEQIEGVPIKEPSVAFSIKFSDLNSTDKPKLPEELNDVAESEVDLRVIGEFQNKFEELLERDSLTFDYSEKSSVLAQESSANISVSYSGKNDAFKYTMEGTSNKISFTANYENGIYTEGENEMESNDEAEIAKIESLLQPLPFMPVYVSKMEAVVGESGVYKMIMEDAGEPLVRSLFPEASSVRSSKMTVIPYYNSENGDLEKYKFDFECSVYIASYGTVSVRLTATVTVKS